MTVPIEKKENLILVQAFPANETITSGAIELLQQYYNVYFINYPGFHPKETKLEEYDFQNIVHFVEGKVEELNLESYILGGASFGFSIINNMEIDKDKCIAIYGLLPYLGRDYHTMTNRRWLLMKYLLDAIEMRNFYEKFWGKENSEKILKNLVGNGNSTFIHDFFNDVDPEAFIKLSRTVLNYDEKPEFKKDIPYLIMISPEDETVDYKETVTELLKGIPHDNLRIIPIHLPHFPPDLSYEYFKSRITENEIEQALGFIEYTRGRQGNLMFSS